MDRREFLRTGGAALVAIPILHEAALAVLDKESEHGTVTVDVAELEHDGDFIVENSAKPEGKPLLILRRKSDQFEALSMRCTHKGCKVETPKEGENSLSLPRFDLRPGWNSRGGTGNVQSYQL